MFIIFYKHIINMHNNKKFDFNSVHAYKIADLIYAVKPTPWPGSHINNSLQHRDLCFDALAGFIDANDIDLLRNSPAGQMCRNANMLQMIRNGRTKVNNFRFPNTQARRQLFKQAFIETGDIHQALHLCKSRVNMDDPDSNELLNYCDIDAATLELTLQHDLDNVPDSKLQTFNGKYVHPELWKADELHSEKHRLVKEQNNIQHDKSNIVENYEPNIIENYECSCNSGWGFWVGLGSVVVSLLLMIVIMTCRKNKKK